MVTEETEREIDYITYWLMTLNKNKDHKTGTKSLSDCKNSSFVKESFIQYDVKLEIKTIKLSVFAEIVEKRSQGSFCNQCSRPLLTIKSNACY